MKNALIFSFYHNNPHFINLQYKSFQKYIQDEWEFAVIDDSTPNTQSLLSGRKAGEEIAEECQKYGIRHIVAPQSIHAFKDQGGIINREDSLGNVHHPTERHQALLRWTLDNHKNLGFDQYKTLVLFDADMFVKQPLNISEFMEDYDMIGSHRPQVITTSHLEPHLISDDIRQVENKKIDFFTLCLLFVNMQTVKNLETFDNRSYLRISDTGGKSHKFIENNPQYKYLFLGDMNSQDYRTDFFFKKEKPYSIDSAEIIHYRAGSNWSNETIPYYRAKLNIMLKRFLPDFATDETIPNDVVSANKEHIIKRNI